MRRSEHERRLDELRLAALLFPDIARVVADAQAPEQLIAERLDERVRELSEEGQYLAAAGCDALGEHSLAQLSRAVAFARETWPDQDPPGVEVLVERVVNLDSLAAATEADETMTWVLAPHGLGIDAWQRVFDSVVGAPSLSVSREVHDEFELLELVPSEGQVTTIPAATRLVHTGEPGVRFWSVAAIPAANRAPVMGYNHAHGPHPLIAELLTLQLMRVRGGLTPVDAHSFTWVDGRIGEGRLAVRHVYDAPEHALRLSTREWAQQGPHQGARPPIRQVFAAQGFGGPAR